MGKCVDQFTFLDNNISSTESNVSVCIAKVWTAIGSLLIIWKYNLSGEIKRDFFQAVAVSELLYRCTTRPLTECLRVKTKIGTTQECYALF